MTEEKHRMPRNLYELVTLHMEDRYADRMAFRWYDDAAGSVQYRTYRQCAQDIRRAVHYFKSTVPQLRGSRICIWSSNSYAYAINCYAVMLAGGVIVPLNQRKSWEELHEEIADRKSVV